MNKKNLGFPRAVGISLCLLLLSTSYLLGEADSSPNPVSTPSSIQPAVYASHAILRIQNRSLDELNVYAFTAESMRTQGLPPKEIHRKLDDLELEFKALRSSGDIRTWYDKMFYILQAGSQVFGAEERWTLFSRHASESILVIHPRKLSKKVQRFGVPMHCKLYLMLLAEGPIRPTI